MDETQLRPNLSPRSIIRTLLKRKLLITFLWLAGSGATIAIVLHLRPVYSADALILVESQKIPESFVAATVQTTLEVRLDLLKRQVLSAERLWNLIEELNLYDRQRLTHTREEVLQMMRNDITINLERGWSADRPGAFRVEYRAPTPFLAAEVTNRMGRFFIDENLRERQVEADGTLQFLSNQLEASKQALQEQEAKLSAFKVSHSGELPEQQSALLATLAQNKTELAGVQDAIGRLQQNAVVVQATLAAAQDNLLMRESLARERSVEVTPVATPASVAGPTDLDRAEAQLRSLRMRYEDKHPAIQDLLAEIARLQQARANRTQTQAKGAATATTPKEEPPADETIINERERIASLQAQLPQIEKQIREQEARQRQLLQDAADAEGRIQKLPVREQELASITRDYETSQTNYKSLLDKEMAAEVAARMERRQKAEKFVMLDPARVPEKPIRPRRVLWSAAGTVGCLLLAALLAFLLELKADVILGEWELPAGTVVIGRVPRMAVSRT